MNIENLTSTQLRKAADLQEEIQKLQSELSSIVGSQSPEPVQSALPGKRGPKKGGMSAEGRAKIAAAQKARWAKVNAAKTAALKPATKVVAVKSAEKPVKRKMSAAGRAAIAAGARARWAKVKGTKTGAKTEPKAGKRTMSAAAKLAISRAAKARWAKVRAAKKA